MTTIVLADDHALIHTGLRAVLDIELDWWMVGEATDGREALALVARLRPDVLIVDLMLPGLLGLEVIRQVHERVAQTQVVVLSMHANESYSNPIGFVKWERIFLGGCAPKPRSR